MKKKIVASKCIPVPFSQLKCSHALYYKEQIQHTIVSFSDIVSVVRVSHINLSWLHCIYATAEDM